MFSLQLMGDIDNNFACNSVRLIQAGSQRRGHVKIRGKHFWGQIWPSCDSQITMKGLIFFWVMFSYWFGLCEEGWAPKNWCFWTVMLENTLESPLDCKEIQPVHPKGDQSWVFIGRTDAEAETPVLWPPHVKSWLIGKDSDAGRDWGQEEKGTTEDEMAGWHHRLDVPEFEWIPGVGDGQGGLACCDSWGRKELYTTEWLNWTELCLQSASFLHFAF